MPSKNKQEKLHSAEWKAKTKHNRADMKREQKYIREKLAEKKQLNEKEKK